MVYDGSIQGSNPSSDMCKVEVLPSDGSDVRRMEQFNQLGKICPQLKFRDAPSFLEQRWENYSKAKIQGKTRSAFECNIVRNWRLKLDFALL